MTYCIAARVDTGLVFISDSRTNAGVYQLRIYSKMHRFDESAGRFFTLLSAGNLATSQAVVARLRRDLRDEAELSLATVGRLREAADYVGQVSRKVQKKYAEKDRPDGFSPDADFILGGQIGSDQHGLFHIYPQGNYVEPMERAPFLQLGEQKYGRPILDRIIRSDTDLETVARCGLVSMDSTMQSNATVGPPIEVLLYRSGNPATPVHIVFDEDDPYLKAIKQAWGENLRRAFDALPPLELPEANIRIVDR